jgi:hypothetical protein
MQDSDLDDFVDAALVALGIPIERAWKPAVVGNFATILRAASLVDGFPLSDDAEPAPTFQP